MFQEVHRIQLDEYTVIDEEFDAALAALRESMDVFMEHDPQLLLQSILRCYETQRRPQTALVDARIVATLVKPLLQKTSQLLLGL